MQESSGTVNTGELAGNTKFRAKLVKPSFTESGVMWIANEK